jgi:putative oxidoreductase
MARRNFRETTDLSSIENTGLTWAPRLLSVLRTVVGLLFIEHGTSKLFGFPPMPGAEGLAIFSLIGLSAILEFVGGLLMTVGLFTRATAFILSGEMAVAYFMAHAPKGFYPLLNHGEPAILYCFVFLYFAAAGGGPWSIDSRR